MSIDPIANKAQCDETRDGHSEEPPRIALRGDRALDTRRVACFGMSKGSNTGGKQTSGLAPAAARLTMFTDARQLMHAINLLI